MPMTAESLARALKARRSGHGWMAKCPAHDDRNPSLSIREANGKVLVHCHGGCSQDAVIEALRACGLWPKREAHPNTARARQEWARERRRIERYLPAAQLWRRAAIVFGEQILESLKYSLIDGTISQQELGEIAYWTAQLVSWQRVHDGALVAEFRVWVRRDPRLTAALVRAGQVLKEVQSAALRAHLDAITVDPA